ncbi:glycoside hydrolase family 127 protein [Demequina sp. SYSU T00039]|uniref:Glycoside hydrolase family 127 protein n=1 Tax=Demequina lignilytica TaxID=3051663 RepID=A0AAW7M974_9MICO|nr:MULTISPECIES: beta-L-arabinofuranosidase domain-containing protein [unclassified Demequina]MDN4477792.1 glycoside hydrolase family 127 protein [Demequina sp. SYSU T00039-1]MDN4487701.1 glycoside hydrolase family 127 protein [Demequina sp. SYSU T00039]MDN4491412.1 glycoside hydrolase family 127 protein [Demequina sp. SYSU T00068]
MTSLQRCRTVVTPARGFPAGAIALTGGPLLAALERSVATALAHDPDRLLAPYRREAGLPAVAEPYGDWESRGLDGHIGGHYVSALSHLYAATGRADILANLRAMLDGLQQCQDAVGTGYLGGVPRGVALGEELRGGTIEAEPFALNGRWVPMYNLHKVLNGLIDAFEAAGQDDALEMALAWADWWMGIAAHLTDAQIEAILTAEFGGMNDAFFRLAALTGREDLEAEGRRWSHRLLLDPLLAGEDRLDGLHANTQVPKVVGYARSGAPDLRGAARVFWDEVVNDRTVSIGGHGVREHFHPKADFRAMVLDPLGPESCNTFGMLQLTDLLRQESDEPALVDFAERAIVNHALTAQHPGHGGFVYFSPLRPAHYRVYSRHGASMWCCVGSGLEGHSRYDRFLFSRDGDSPRVEIYEPARLDWDGIAIEVRADLARSWRVEVDITAETPHDRVVRLRVPDWSDGAEVTVDGEAHPVARGDREVALGGRWEGTSRIVLTLRPVVTAERLPDGSPWASFRYGPFVLAHRDGDDALEGQVAAAPDAPHIALGTKRRMTLTPAVLDADPTAAFTPAAEGATATLSAWRLDGEAPEQVSLDLEPYNAIHDERCTVYWPVGATASEVRDRLAELDADELEDADLVDVVAPGEQQSEMDHAYASQASRIAWTNARSWRLAEDWFSYVVKPKVAGPHLVRIRTLAGVPVGSDDAVVRLGGRVATPATTGMRALPLYGDVTEAVYEVDVPAEGIEVRFEAGAGGVTGGVVAVALLTPPA